MNPETLYLLKTNGVIIAGFLFYFFLLKKETFYGWKRWYFLSLIPLSCLIPLYDPFKLPSTALAVVKPIVIPNNLVFSGSNSGFSFEHYFFFVTIAVSILLLLHLGIQLMSLMRMHKQAQEATDYKGCRVRHVEKIVNPFSFLRCIYINPQLHHGPALDSIMNHELIHIRKMHSCDILLFEIFCACFWYNPCIWLIRAAMKQNIEFFTDKQVLDMGYDRRHYQQDLLKVSQLPTIAGIANNFNFNHLKTRIMMMNRKQSNPVRLLKFALIVPALVLVTLVVTAKDPIANVIKSIPVISEGITTPAKETSSQDLSKQNPAKKQNNKQPKSKVAQGSAEIIDIRTKDSNEQKLVATGQLFPFSIGKDTYDFGTIDHSNGDVTTVFSMTNLGDGPLVISNVVTSCGCTSTEWTKEPMAKGKTGYVKVTYAAKTHIGPFLKSVTVTLKDRTQSYSEIFTIEGTVL